MAGFGGTVKLMEINSNLFSRPLLQGNLGSPGPKCVPAVGPSGLNVGGVGAMVRSSIVESS